MKNSRFKEGNNITIPAPAGGVVSGTPYLIGSLFGIASTTESAGDNFVLCVDGIYELSKTSAQAWAVGELVYWDNTAKVVTTTSAGNTKIGVAVRAAANPSATGFVRLNAAF